MSFCVSLPFGILFPLLCFVLDYFLTRKSSLFFACESLKKGIEHLCSGSFELDTGFTSVCLEVSFSLVGVFQL